MDSEQSNIQSQIRRIRRTIFGVISVVVLALVAILLFVPVDERVIASGIVRAEWDTYLYAPVDGTLAKIEVNEGEAVEKDAPILRLDDTELQEQLRKIEASIDKATVELEHKKKTLERTSRLPLPSQFWHMQEEMTIAREKILQNQSEYQRAKNLLAKGLVSQQDLERAQLAIDVAKAEEAKGQKKVEIIEGGLEGSILDEAKAEIQSALSTLRQLDVERNICRETMGRLVLRAPAAGTVTYLKERRPGVGVIRGENLARIAHGEAKRVEIFCGESQYHRIAPGQRVLMRSNSFDTLRYGYMEGRITKVAIEPETENPLAPSQTGPKYRVTAMVESSPQTPTLGSTVEARIIIRRIPFWKLLLPDTLK